ncbi:hypothetical protein [Parafrankia sp. BMG5.11]|uniref:hypothetical protein n=1 Tax=Parafrankia sp. BMG5.11 TaxID=222540 RepID=UPI001039CF12|nr:hypothetical protein [Parafrankia sp. BMG5.11]TCJ37374.1 hypothetical protein E0504_20265 [Parafrankia sp. BMG5.11]
MLDPTTILAAVPAALQSEFAAGKIYRVGMLLFRQGVPGIAGHLIETRGLDTAVQALSAASPAGMLVNLGVQAVGQIITGVQNEQIKTALTTLQTLQIGGLALSGIGIGVSIVSAALISVKVDRVSKQVEQMDSKLDRIARSVEQLRADAIQRDFVRLRTASELADEAWKLSDPEPQWNSAARELLEIQNVFFSRARQLMSVSNDVNLVEPFIDALSMAAATRITCRVATGELPAAIDAAERFAAELSDLLEPVGAHQIASSRLQTDKVSAADPGYVTALERLRPFAEAQASLYREREAAASSTPLTLKRVRELGLHGRQWLETARGETDEPILLLKGEAAD